MAKAKLSANCIHLRLIWRSVPLLCFFNAIKGNDHKSSRGCAVDVGDHFRARDVIAPDGRKRLWSNFWGQLLPKGIVVSYLIDFDNGVRTRDFVLRVQ